MLVYQEGEIKVYAAVSDASAKGRTRLAEERAEVGRLLSEAFSDCSAKPMLGHQPNGAPVLTGVDAMVSVSHCPGAVCIATGPLGKRIGIDAECGLRGGQLKRVADKFLTPAQKAVWGGDEWQLLRAWTIKEALYKAALAPGLTLHDIPLPGSLRLSCGGCLVLRGRCYEIKPLSIRRFNGSVILVVEK